MSKNIKVGIFVTLALLVSGVFVFMIGDNRRMWETKVTFHATFGDVSGLKPGAPIRMAGVDVGTVGEVGHAVDAKDTKIHVTLNIVRSEAGRVRQDPDVSELEAAKKDRPRGTIAKVVNKGLLGDKMIELTVGDQRFPEAVPNTQLRTEEPMDLGKYITKLESIGEKAEKTLGNIERITGSLANDKFSQDLQGTVAAVHDILDAVAHNKDGAAHKLLFDKQEAQKIEALLSNLVVISGNVSAITNDVHGMTTRVNQGPGLAHALLYDEQMAQGVTGSLVELKNTLEAVRTKEGLAHAVVYGDPNTQKVLQNVGAMSDDMRVVVANVRQGKGTIGGLLVDPSIYEDLKAIVGNVERNQVLRALVRYSIKEGEQKPHAETPKLSTPASAPPKAEAQK
ncbi:MAG: MCE family protein [Myxococcales bacterium]|nr:MCE family protein [Myxococcales bacterium]MBL9109066.1 MCE family protein [Myxococcales bacterium]